MFCKITRVCYQAAEQAYETLPSRHNSVGAHKKTVLRNQSSLVAGRGLERGAARLSRRGQHKLQHVPTLNYAALICRGRGESGPVRPIVQSAHYVPQYFPMNKFSPNSASLFPRIFSIVLSLCSSAILKIFLFTILSSCICF